MFNWASSASAFDTDLPSSMSELAMLDELPPAVASSPEVPGGPYRLAVGNSTPRLPGVGVPYCGWLEASGSPATPPGPNSSGAQTRRIYTDGRENLAGDDLVPQYTGNSVGRWEGDTLVVTTVGLNDIPFVDRTGARLSEDAVVRERIRLVAPDTLEDRFTIEDKTALTGPWVVTRTWRRLPKGSPVVDDSCLGKRVNPAELVDAAAARAGR